MFTRIDGHELDGAIGHYVMPGVTPVTCTTPNGRDGLCVVHNGDGVRVLSVHDRGDGFILLYIESFVTGLRTHVPVSNFAKLGHGTIAPLVSQHLHTAVTS